MKPITLFSWGYYGWGNSTTQLVQAVDAVEESRGLKPPMFVDIRIQRSVRAIGFRDKNFEKLLGEDRHRWIRGLGNQSIVTHAKQMKIAEPKAAEELLDLALENAGQQRRVIFFCGCIFRKLNGKPACHRTAVTRLVLAAAKKRRTPIEIVEWPGGKPNHFDAEVSPEIFRAVANGRWYIPLGEQRDPPSAAGLPWGSTASVYAPGRTIHRLAGPAIYTRNQWNLTLFWKFGDPATPLSRYERAAPAILKKYGFEPSYS